MSDLEAQRDVNSRELLADWVAGRPDAADRIFSRYASRLLPLIRKQLSQKMQTRIDAEDVAQSAMGSFFVRASNYQFVLERSGDLWRLLAAISLNKLRRSIAWHSAAKRSQSCEEKTVAESPDSAPSHEDAIAVLEIAQNIFQALSADEQAVLRLTISGDTPEQIATAMGRSPRTIRRWQQSLRAMLEEKLSLTKPPIKDSRATLSWEDYLLKQHIGSGGFGKVYRAVEKRRSRTVAIKALHKHHQSDPFAVEQFIQESNLLARIHHPCVVGVHGLGQYPGGGYFLVLDWVDGEDLQQVIDRQPIVADEAMRIVRQVALGIHAAHEANIVHGDLKPANILISRKRTVQITDFGLAALRSDRPWKIGMRGGTAAYLAPELLNGTTIDGTIDVYGLGGLLYAMLTGLPPRRGSTTEVLRQVEMHSQPTPPSVVRPDLNITPAVEELVMRCLAPDPAHRYRDVTTFLETAQRVSFI